MAPWRHCSDASDPMAYTGTMNMILMMYLCNTNISQRLRVSSLMHQADAARGTTTQLTPPRLT
jgi:hypothetical protein